MLKRSHHQILFSAEYIASYSKKRSRPLPRDMNFYISFSLFRAAAIIQGVYKRFLFCPFFFFEINLILFLTEFVSQGITRKRKQ
jgi:hypothetical protein